MSHCFLVEEKRAKGQSEQIACNHLVETISLGLLLLILINVNQRNVHKSARSLALSTRQENSALRLVRHQLSAKFLKTSASVAVCASKDAHTEQSKSLIYLRVLRVKLLTDMDRTPSSFIDFQFQDQMKFLDLSVRMELGNQQPLEF